MLPLVCFERLELGNGEEERIKKGRRRRERKQRERGERMTRRKRRRKMTMMSYSRHTLKHYLLFIGNSSITG